MKFVKLYNFARNNSHLFINAQKSLLYIYIYIYIYMCVCVCVCVCVLLLPGVEHSSEGINGCHKRYAKLF